MFLLLWGKYAPVDRRVRRLALCMIMRTEERARVLNEDRQ